MTENLSNNKYNSGQWTDARFHSFIKSALRRLTYRWGPKNEAKKKAWVKRGVYKCAGHNRRAHQVPISKVVKGKRINNVFVDHIEPVIDPIKGFVSWDETIDRMFCEVEGFQILCKECHDSKTQEEKRIRKANG